MPIDCRPTVTTPDDDPYLWLEEIEGAKAVAWADAQTAATREAVMTSAALADRNMLAALLDRPDKLPRISRRGAHIYNFWQDKQSPRGLWRRTTLDDFRCAEPTWDVILDVDALATADGADWVWRGATTLPGTHDCALISLSRGGSEASVLREFDMTTRAFVEGGFHLAEAKTEIAWVDRDTLLVASPFGGAAFATASGYARTVRLWRRGEDFSTSKVVFEVDTAHMRVRVVVDRTTSPPRVRFTDRVAFYDMIDHLGDAAGPRTQLDIPSDCERSLHREWLIVRPSKAWDVGGEIVLPGQVVVFNLADFVAGRRKPTTLFTPTDRCVVWFLWETIDGMIKLTVLDNLKMRHEIHEPTPTGWTKRTLDGLPTLGVTFVSPLDVSPEASNGDFLALSEDPLTPLSLMLIARGKPPEVLRRAPADFDASGKVVVQHEAIAADGERIPYTLIGPDSAPTGNAPVLMTGYGGFEVPLLPRYSTETGKLWLERGGTAVIANIRGGGEFGVRWHKAGRCAKKITSHDDFAAVAADLVARGITKPSRIAAEGRSNGGLLIANMLTRYPERFGALFCSVAVIDMRRYTKLHPGRSWIAEYGDPDLPEEWAYLQHTSAYHTAEPGKAYPPILIAMTRNDDRVHPGHGRKFAAKLQAMGYTNVAYLESPTGGHGLGKDTAEMATFTTLGLTFLARHIGWDWRALVE
jgi:prolyl oligopeptidase